MNGGGVLYDDKRPAHVASLIEAIVDDEALAEAILASQDAALERLAEQDFDGTLLRYVREALAAPAGVAPAVSFDFWDQFELQEQLEEVRQYRPSALRALPAFAGASNTQAPATARQAPDEPSQTADAVPGTRHPAPGA